MTRGEASMLFSLSELVLRIGMETNTAMKTRTCWAEYVNAEGKLVAEYDYQTVRTWLRSQGI